MDQLLAMIAWAALLLIMALLTIDVVLRYAFNSPLTWAFDLISLYLMACVFFFGLADTLRHNENVAVDILYGRLGGRAKSLCDVIIYIAATVFFGLMFYVTLVAAVESAAQGEVMAGLIPWPIWAGYLLAPIGTLPALVLSGVRLGVAIYELAAGPAVPHTAAPHEPPIL
ncbi:TRAP-type C4-dicarboxylate transport system permease small subunit [Rhodoligotrophos appendicifer]|uniref:TRAP transporter small permease subunit n=1 Tax=Rhodoligotrophos appendicifer TaxID=987056 RepID=UPI0014795F90|nr:TRAP transporter small permease subunit [Rhodoligotrophos appendicifer]